MFAQCARGRRIRCHLLAHSLALLLSIYSLAYPSDCPSTPAHLSAGSPTCSARVRRPCLCAGHPPGALAVGVRVALHVATATAPAHSVSTTPSAMHPPSVRRSCLRAGHLLSRLTVGVCLSLACSSARRPFVSHACMLAIVMRRAARRRVACS
ncbi:uncharacterized protein B0H18DRAFT_505162 [Fomitopsis serialis]|uniref:uncharacterized protein n=1 Tax=Fomitopsis serialis TaxID=139415 RepID=UPI0020075533|nr:uncharacterized protein B0H18DRAFT_505162 [Neoantrodia serialis]KAH9910204.1 hypothetical protein B0H18DRAFT_505162 [Neoantrodia serialis]